MKLVAKPALDLQDDPRPKDRALWNGLRLLIESELAHPAWRCALYRLHREGRIDNDEREAGDRYWRVVDDYRRTQATDPEESPEIERELEYKRINRAKKRYNEVLGMIGFGRRVLDPLIFENEWPRSEREHLIVKQCLIVLKNFFATGTKRGRSRGQK